MRCSCCNRNLSDYESTRKSKSTGDYLDMCNKCFGTVSDDFDTIVNPDMSELDEEDDSYQEIKAEWDDFDDRYEN